MLHPSLNTALFSTGCLLQGQGAWLQTPNPAGAAQLVSIRQVSSPELKGKVQGF